MLINTTHWGLLKLHLRHLRQEGDLHFLALCGQALKQRLVGPLGIEDGGLITLQEKNKILSQNLGSKNAFSFLPHKQWTLTKSLRCRAQTRPSPPLLPGPQITSTEGEAFTREVSGYACKKKRGKTSKKKTSLRSADWMFVDARLRAHSGDGSGTAESSQLHQLVHAEAILTEELLINVLGLLLPEDHKHISLQSAMFCFFCFSFF